jgi:hypothetical protein
MGYPQAKHKQVFDLYSLLLVIPNKVRQQQQQSSTDKNILIEGCPCVSRFSEKRS